MKMQDIAEQIRTDSVVTCQQGSWRWQQPWRAVDYQARLLSDGRILWTPVTWSQKLTLNRALALNETDNMYSLNNKPVPRPVAIAQVGARAVKQLEQHGWRFEI